MIHANVRRYSYSTLLVLFTILTHVTYINNGFIWLDHIDLEGKSALVATLPRALFSPYSQTTFYRPLVAMAHSIDYALYSHWAPGFHVTNILMHTLVVVLTYHVIRKVIRVEEKFAFLASFIVMLHPANTYSIGLISYRTDPLAVACVLSAVLFFLKYQENRSNKYIVYASSMFMLSLLAKETSLLWYPAIILVLLLYYKEQSKKIIISTVGSTAVISILYFVLRINAVHSMWGIGSTPLNVSNGIGTRGIAVVRLIEYILIPILPPISDSIKITSLSLPIVAVALVFILMNYWGLYKYRSHRSLLLIYALFIVSIAPAFNILPLPRFISPHYLYFSTVIVSLAGALLLQHVNKNMRTILLTVFFTWVALTAYISFASGHRFSSDRTFFLPEVEKDIHFREGAYYVGSALLKAKEYDQSEKYLRQSLSKDNSYIAYVDSSAASNNLALVLIQKNKLTEAESLLNQSIREDTQESRTGKVYNLALLKLRLNKPETAVQIAENEILKAKHAPVEMYLVLAQAYIQTAQKDKAKLLLTQVKPLLQTAIERDLWHKTEQMLP